MQVEVSVGTLRRLQNPERDNIRPVAPVVYDLTPKEDGSIFVPVRTHLSPYLFIVQNTQDEEIVVTWRGLQGVVARDMQGELVHADGRNFADLTDETTLLSWSHWDRRYKLTCLRLLNWTRIEASPISPESRLSAAVELPVPQ